jgi:tRNA pseudouridine55 synthase
VRDEIHAVLAKFRGTFEQAPPAFSAKKIAGVAAYEKARNNQPVELKPVPVTVRELEVLDTSDIGSRASAIGLRDASLLRLRVAASAGFYVRSLAHDIGQALGCGAHLEALRRTRVGRFRVEDGMTLDQIEARGSESIVPVTDLLGQMPAIDLTADGARRTAHGNPLGPDHTKNGDSHLFLRKTVTATVFVRLIAPDGAVAAVAEARPDGLLHPIVVLG